MPFPRNSYLSFTSKLIIYQESCKMLLLSFTMTGTRHSQAYSLHKLDIKPGDEIEFELDQHNAYDKDAIKILWQGEHIGWVPKKLYEAKSMLTRLLEEADDLGIVITAEVNSHEPENPADMQLQIDVYLL